jgi:hypothetical protein
MKMTFGEIRLFNDDLFQNETSFIFNGKEWGIGNGGERTRERKSERQRVGEKWLRQGS